MPKPEELARASVVMLPWGSSRRSNFGFFFLRANDLDACALDADHYNANHRRHREPSSMFTIWCCCGCCCTSGSGGENAEKVLLWLADQSLVPSPMQKWFTFVQSRISSSNFVQFRTSNWNVQFRKCSLRKYIPLDVSWTNQLNHYINKST